MTKIAKFQNKNFSISIIMYHYVREIKNSKYSNLKGLEFKDFRKQINYFCKNFNILSKSDFIEIIQTKKIPKKPSIFLTFDDGYIDHYQYVFPYLHEKKITGSFYPPVKAIENKMVLDVNKIHFILEKEQNSKLILKEIDNYLLKVKLKPLSEQNLSKINLKSKYDNRNIVLIKRLLQFYFPEHLRKKIINYLFAKFLNKDINEFSKELYMNKRQIKEMYSEKMDFGSHGVNHYWWKFLKKNEQEKEILNSRKFFENLGFDSKNFSVCFPYGSYNTDTINLLKKNNIKFALTSKFGGVDKTNLKNNLTLPRYDTNDI